MSQLYTPMRPSMGGWPDGITPGFIEVGADPTTGSGFQCPIGSIAKFGTTYYEKTGTGANLWTAKPVVSPGWVAATAVQLCGLLNISPSTARVRSDTFDAVGTTGIGDSSFSEQWTATVGIGGAMTHKAPGIARAYQPAGGFANCSLIWKGPGGLAGDALNDKWAMGFRTKTTMFSNTNQDRAYWGVGDQPALASWKIFGYDGGLSTAFASFWSTNDNTAVSTCPVATIFSQFDLYMIQLPVAGVRTMRIYVNGTLVLTVPLNSAVGGYGSLNPHFFQNHGETLVDNFVFVYPGGL